MLQYYCSKTCQKCRKKHNTMTVFSQIVCDDVTVDYA